jgi:hypothetical protein
MRIFSVCSSLLLAAALCPAQDTAFHGNWHLNVEKSHWNETARPVSVVVAIQHNGDEIQYNGSVLYANEDVRTFGFGGAFNGRPYRMSRSYGDGAITLKRVNPLCFDSTFRTDDGLYTEAARTTVTRDLRTMTRKLTLRTPEGTQNWVEIYEKR